MLQKYQNEISPIIYYGISTKINEKDLKIPILQPPDWKHPYWMTLYELEASSSNILMGLMSIKHLSTPSMKIEWKWKCGQACLYNSTLIELYLLHHAPVNEMRYLNCFINSNN